MRESKVLNKLRSGGYALCTQIGSAAAPFVGMAAQIGYDCVWIDQEHKAISDSMLRECIYASQIYDCDTVIRILKRSYADYFRPLEDGATGIMVPHCMSAEDAAIAARNTKFYPLGLRGQDFSSLGSDFMTSKPEAVMEHSNKHTFTMLQVEDVEALRDLDGIVQTEGVEILFIGPTDLLQSSKKFGLSSSKFLEEAYKKVNDAVSKRKGVWWGTTVGSPEAAKSVYEAGARFINVKGDFSAVLTAFTKTYLDTIDLLER
jgi:4-hydroxy-2-oxoheptanedioate aldolase